MAVAILSKPTGRGDSTSPMMSPGQPARTVPNWYPAWAREFADLYFTGTTCLFVIHGNVHDLIARGETEGSDYGDLPDFISTQLFGSWDVVLRFDLSQGLRLYAGSDGARLGRMTARINERIGEAKTWPREPDAVFILLDQLVRQILMEEDPGKQISVGVIFEYSQYLVPSAELGQLIGPQGTRLVRLLSWAQNPYIKQHNIAFCLLCEKLAEMNDRLIGSAHVANLEVPLPDARARERFIAEYDRRDGTGGNLAGFPPAQLADLTSGLNLTNLERLLAMAAQSGRHLDSGGLKQLKKALIERQARGLVEFIEPPHSLADFVGSHAIKLRMSEDADLLSNGRLDTAPMGYLICGPVGTGKTYLAECFAGSVGIPCVKLRNFRSKYVGETEGNLEQILNVLRAMGPVVIVIDEADAALGNREGGGDSGTSSRVFSMIASQMGDTRYRGKLIWMLLTSRPDLLPIDLKRQGRAEIHLPLFSPSSDDEIHFMIRAMARKNRSTLEPEVLPINLSCRGLSGSDIESIVLSAKRRALTKGRETVSPEDLSTALNDFIPSAQGLEKEKQELAAVLECTSMSFLPDEWRARVGEPDGRSKLQERLAAIRRLIQE